MNILIVEDNQKKLKNLKSWAGNNISNAVIEEAISYTSGVRKIYEGDWDLILLDMSLPTYDITPQEQGGDKKPLAGKEIMRRMIFRNINTPVIIVTQFETFGDKEISIRFLNEEFEKDYSSIWKGTINYDEIKMTWVEELNRIYTEILGE